MTRANITYAQQIDGLRKAGAGSNPMRFEDYRRPIREAMLRDAREALLRSAAAPDYIIATLGSRPITGWSDQARSMVRLGRSSEKG